jgi:hypothetical protein
LALSSRRVHDDYFDDLALDRQRLLWAVATRRQLERWEAIVATIIDAHLYRRPPTGQDFWSAEIERHFALIAARHFLRAVELPPPMRISVDPVLRAEVIEGRDLNEHWAENMPIFNVTPRPATPSRRSGKDFAERNPRRGPYSQSNWNLKTGALLLPNVSAPALHELLDEAEAEVLESTPSLSEYVPERNVTVGVRQRRMVAEAGRRVKVGPATRHTPGAVADDGE